MLPIPLMERFDQSLAALAPLLDPNAPDLPRRAGAWLADVTALAADLHLPCAADLALLRADLASYRPPAESGVNRRQLSRRHAEECLGRARDCIRETFARQRAVCQECGELCMQAVAVARAKGLIRPEDGVQAVVARLGSDEALLPALTQIIGLVGTANATVLIDRALAATEVKEEFH